MLYRGALINEQFKEYQNIIDYLLVFSHDLLRMKNILFRD
jgi:hypothetical protein